MQLDFAMLALNVDHTSNGKLYIFGGAIDTMAVPELPANIPPFNIVARILVEPTEIEPKHRVALRIINPDNESKEAGTISDFAVAKNRIDSSMPGSAIIILSIVMALEKYGTYKFELQFDGITLKTLPLHVLKELPQ